MAYDRQRSADRVARILRRVRGRFGCADRDDVAKRNMYRSRGGRSTITSRRRDHHPPSRSDLEIQQTGTTSDDGARGDTQHDILRRRVVGRERSH